MRVMAAGVHDPGFSTGLADALYLRSIRQAGLLDHRQGIHIGAQHHYRAGSVFKNGDNASLADFLRNCKSKPLCLRRQLGRGTEFLKTEFGVGMKVAVKLHERRHVDLDCLTHFLRLHRHSRRQHGQGDRP